MTGIIDTKDDEFITTDAGLVFNSPYPLVLHPARHVDLILSFEFSAPDKDNWPFSVCTFDIISLATYKVSVNYIRDECKEPNREFTDPTYIVGHLHTE